jgi:hypothetical protein
MEFGRLAAVDIYPDNQVEVAKPFRIEGLCIAFQVKKNLKAESNTARIQIYNLAEGTRNKILEKNRRVQIHAGYEEGDGYKLLFDGSIMTVDHLREVPDRVTRIEANDGEKALRETHVSVSYAQNASADRILKDLIKAMGLPEKFVTSPKAKKLLQGFVHHGPGKDALEKICRSLGLEYSIQNGQIQVLEQGKTDNSPQRGILITPDSGLVGSPERIRQIKDDPKAEKKPEGWRIRCLLQPTLNPGSWVAVQSEAIPKVTAFRIESVEHSGNNIRGPWESVIETTDAGVIL